MFICTFVFVFFFLLFVSAFVRINVLFFRVAVYSVQYADRVTAVRETVGIQRATSFYWQFMSGTGRLHHHTEGMVPQGQ